MKLDFAQELLDFEGQPILDAGLTVEEILFLKQEYLLRKANSPMSEETKRQVHERLESIFSQRRPVTLKQTCLTCLGRVQDLPEIEQDFSFTLGCKLGAAKEPVDLTETEVTLLKREIQKSNFPAIVKGRVRSLLDPKD